MQTEEILASLLSNVNVPIESSENDLQQLRNPSMFRNTALR